MGVLEVVWVSVFLTILCINGNLALAPVRITVQKGQDLTLTCNQNDKCSWRTYYYNITASDLTGNVIPLTNSCTYTVKKISEGNISQAFECGFSSWVLLPINAINSKPTIIKLENNSYSCNASGTGFGQLLFSWTVNNTEVTSGVTTTNRSNGVEVSATSTLQLSSYPNEQVVSCTAYFETNRTNSTSSSFTLPGANSTVVTSSPVLQTSLSESPTAASLPPSLYHTSSLPLPTPSMATTSFGQGLSTTPLVTASSLAAFLVTALILVVVAVVTLMRHRKSKRGDVEESRPSISVPGPSQQAVDPNLLTISQPTSAEEETRASNYDVVQRIAPKKDEEEGVYHHLKRPTPQQSAPVEIYGQLNPSHRSSHSSLHSASSSSSHRGQYQQRVGHSPACCSAEPICPNHRTCHSDSAHHTCCGESVHQTCHGGSAHHKCHNNMSSIGTIHHTPSHVCHACCNGSGPLHTRSESLPCNTGGPDSPTQLQPVLPSSLLRAARPTNLPLANCNAFPSSHMPCHVKTPTSHLLPVQHQRRRSKSLTMVVEVPTPMETPCEQQVQSRVQTPMPPLNTRCLQAAFSTHDIPTIILNSGSPVTALHLPEKFQGDLATENAYNSTIVDTKIPTSRNQVPLSVEPPSNMGSNSIVIPNLNRSSRSVQSQRSDKETWVPRKLNQGSHASLCLTSSGESRTIRYYSLPYCGSNSSHLQGYSDMRSDGGYETDRDMLQETLKNKSLLRLPSRASAERESLV